MRLRAITNLYSEVVRATENGSYDKYGALVAIDESKVDVERKRLEAAEPMRLLRTKRDRLLAECDWWASSDLTMSAKRKSYRQALRDLPASASPSLDDSGQLTGVTWPTKPK